MIKKIVAIVVVLGLISIAVVQAMNHTADKKTETEQKPAINNQLGGLTIGVKAPDFTLHSIKGDEVKLSDFKGKKVLLNFWATWCPPCKKEIPDIQKFYETADKNMVILAVNIDPENDVIGFADKNHLTFPILLDHQDKDKPVSNQYQVMSIPTSFFIDSKGIIRNKFVGAMELKDIKKNMKQLQ